ncbi:DUF6477 family protein [Marimonas lutisalis]|uniref:DUF6477 family protein n=1 Tax=Marimonas lutisalis TaxID=2545756 RepID=UPI0010F5ADF3|nr:DUF6477 family protein [Marimonas lutisalis]
MSDILNAFDRLSRPQLLIQAARAGMADYCREPHLRRLMGPGNPPCGPNAVARLLPIEAQLNQQRVANDAGYSIIRHVDVLIALMAEAQRLRSALPLEPAE